MRSSRLARETSRIAALTTTSRQPTVSTASSEAANKFASAIRGYALKPEEPLSAEHGTTVSVNTEATPDNDTSSSLSSPISPSGSDAENQHYDAQLQSRKRKRQGRNKSPVHPIKSETTTEITSIKTAPPSEQVSQPRPRKARRQPAKKEVASDGEVTIHPPLNWAEVYDLTREMRRKVIAPVDTMGCERLAEPDASPKDQRFQTLISLMLSSQTKDTVTAAAIRALQTQLPPPGLTLSNILAISPTELNSLIRQVGFHNNKTNYIKRTAEILRDSFAGDIPDTPEGLISLPGVGPKMAYLCLAAAWGKVVGIGVDVHVHRITNLWGWHKTRNPEETRAALESWLPKDRWHEINHMLVGFGQTICLPVGRKCGECVLAERGLCPSAVVRKTVETKIKRKKEVLTGNEAGQGLLEGVQEKETKVQLDVAEKEQTIKIEDLEDFENIPRSLQGRGLRPRA